MYCRTGIIYASDQVLILEIVSTHFCIESSISKPDILKLLIALLTIIRRTLQYSIRLFKGIAFVLASLPFLSHLTFYTYSIIPLEKMLTRCLIYYTFPRENYLWICVNIVTTILVTSLLIRTIHYRLFVPKSGRVMQFSLTFASIIAMLFAAFFRCHLEHLERSSNSDDVNGFLMTLRIIPTTAAITVIPWALGLLLWVVWQVFVGVTNLLFWSVAGTKLVKKVGHSDEILERVEVCTWIDVQREFDGKSSVSVELAVDQVCVLFYPSLSI